MATVVKRPQTAEYAPYYHGYVSLVPGDDILQHLATQIDVTTRLLRSIPEEKGDFRYAEGKWSIRELLGHMIDTERVLAYRALAFSRLETASLPSFDQDGWNAASPYSHCKLADLIEEFAIVRRSTLCLLRNLTDDDFHRSGIASNVGVTVRAIAYIIGGHELSHMKTLRERYL